jgi:hypothetical protein
MTVNKEQFIAFLEKTGEVRVRERLACQKFFGNHIGWATVWLEERDRARAASVAASQEELARSQTSAARDAAEAAQVQATAAEEANQIALDANAKADTANTIATLALIAAMIAIAVAVLDAFVGGNSN